MKGIYHIIGLKSFMLSLSKGIVGRIKEFYEENKDDDTPRSHAEWILKYKQWSATKQWKESRNETSFKK